MLQSSPREFKLSVLTHKLGLGLELGLRRDSEDSWPFLGLGLRNSPTCEKIMKQVCDAYLNSRYKVSVQYSTDRYIRRYRATGNKSTASPSSFFMKPARFTVGKATTSDFARHVGQGSNLQSISMRIITKHINDSKSFKVHNS